MFYGFRNEEMWHITNVATPIKSRIVGDVVYSYTWIDIVSVMILSAAVETDVMCSTSPLLWGALKKISTLRSRNKKCVHPRRIIS